ncbi:uracil-DNA glycosylase [Roseibium algae]|uniref:Type-4 uracil-DNA glycosylase n=1 Tax=Roseibium algae TaxID=3123038 RepID=A0ABU8TH33_9HYPH
MQTHDAAQRQLESLLEFYQASGFDCFLEEEAIDRFALSAELLAAQVAARQAGAHSPGIAGSGPTSKPTQSGRSAIPGAGQGTMQTQGVDTTAAKSSAPNAPVAGGAFADAVIPDRDAINSAHEVARSAKTLDELQASLAAFTGCNLRLTAKNLVFSDGNPKARVMLIGEAPGRDDDIKGLPFVGPSGPVLDKMLEAIGLDRSSVYIANVVPWRPPGNRTPTPQEAEICKPFIVRQIELVAPEYLVFLGAASTKSLLGVQDGIRRMRGRWMTYSSGQRQVPCLATYHPDYLLNTPIEKRLSWRDFLVLRDKLKSVVDL